MYCTYVEFEFPALQLAPLKNVPARLGNFPMGNEKREIHEGKTGK